MMGEPLLSNQVFTPIALTASWLGFLRKCRVKIVDDRGIESLRVIAVE